MPSNNRKPKGYDKENHLASLHDLVDSIKKGEPYENVYVDEETAEVIWGLKQDKQKKKDKTIDECFDKIKKDYPWL